MTACTLERNWPPYILASLITFFGGLVILLPFRLAWIGCREKRRTVLKEHRTIQNQLTRIRTYAENVLSGNSIASKIVVIVFWIIDLAVIGIYLTEAIMFDPEQRDQCGSVWDDRIQRVWLLLMCLNLVRFLIKFLAAHDKFLMWVDLYSIVDHFTIVPTFVGAYFDSNWLALRFLVVVAILKIPDILQIIHVLKNSSKIRIAKAISALLTIWLLGAGMILLLENNGDPFANYENGTPLRYGNCFYFVLITLTTIGYGDISPSTVLGRMWIIIFVLLALALFGSLIPELGKVIASRNKYRNPYKRSYNRRHVVICGGITFETLSTVVRNFIHKDAAIRNTDIVIIDKDKPSSELQAFFRRRFNDVTFIRGSVIDIPTLQLAKTSQAAAVFILANRRVENPNEEDLANIMRATAVKNLSADIRVIIQLLRHQNKEQLLNIPGWNWHKQDGDEIICISQLQMSLLAQNCLAPGIVTMFSNLICMRSSEPSRSFQWMKDYNYGAGHEIYTHVFTSGNGLVGLTFTEAVEICFVNFGVLLIAVECDDGRGHAKLKVNPGQSLVLSADDVGFFIAQDQSEIKRVANYRRQKAGAILNSAFEDPPKVKVEPSSPTEEDIFEYLGEDASARRNSFRRSDQGLATEGSDVGNNNQEVTRVEMLDVTGMFHKSLAKAIESVILDADSVREYDFTNHVIFVLRCGTDVTSDDNDAPSNSGLGLTSFVSPLRASSLGYDELKDIIFYTEVGALKGEWQYISNFPKLYIFQRTRSTHTDLRLLNIHKCSMCIVTSVGGASTIDNTTIDKRTILTTMNILSLQKLEEKVNTIGALTNPDIFRKQIAIGCDVPMLAQLESDASVPYIDDDDDDDPSLPLFQTIPYVCGRVLLASVLDSAVNVAFLNGKIFKLIRALVTGGEISDLEKVIADGVGIVRRPTLLNDFVVTRRRSSLSLLSRNFGPLEKFQDCTEYGELLVKALTTLGFLCLGVYRLLEEDSKDPRRQKRYVITNPPKSFQLVESDKVYVLRPFEPGRRFE